MKRSTVNQSGPVVTGQDIASATLTPRSAAPSTARFRFADATIATNRPISTSHNPPDAPPANDSTPTATSSRPKTCPLRPAARSAQSWPPVRHHTTACSTWPPSSGGGGQQVEHPEEEVGPAEPQQNAGRHRAAEQRVRPPTPPRGPLRRRRGSPAAR
ncbi:hypothetical protein [Streptomyces scopuliridis]|uniref:hypothetical protein n=1 Tax=Streptomyces scopuliridis TaxID=452529 RepID=UPI0036A0A1E1